MKRLPFVSILLALVAVALLGTGCSRGTEDAAPSESEQSSTSEPMRTLPEPGLHRASASLTSAVGILAWREIEGGFFAVVEAKPGEPLSGDEPVVAVILEPEGTQSRDLGALVGSYVEFTGTVNENVSARMAGPEMVADSYQILDYAK